MKHECILRYRTGYPTKEQTISSPLLLRKTPERWKALALTGSAFSFLSLTSCSFFPQIMPGKAINTLPVYLSESDAVRMIVEEAALQGIVFEIDTESKVSVKMPSDISYNFESLEYAYEEKDTELITDGKLKDLNIYFEYISETDFFEMTESSAIHEDVYLRVEFMEKFLKSKENNTLVSDSGDIVKVFYEEAGKDTSMVESDLRRQVREFIEQLKANGVI